MSTNQPETDPEGRPLWTFGDRMRKARRRAGMTGAEFAEALGVTQSALGQYETDRTMPRDVVDLAQRVQALTGVPASWLLGLESAEPPTVSLPVIPPPAA